MIEYIEGGTPTHTAPGSGRLVPACCLCALVCLSLVVERALLEGLREEGVASCRRDLCHARGGQSCSLGRLLVALCACRLVNLILLLPSRLVLM